MMTKPLLITIIAEGVLLAAGGVIDKLFPISSLWIWLGVIAIGGLFLIAMLRRDGNSKRRTPASPAARAPVSPTETVDVVDVSAPNGALMMPNSTPERVYIRRTPKAIVQVARGLTNIAVENMAKPYVGKWMVIEGEVFNVSEFSKTIAVSVFEEVENEMSVSIRMHFSKKKWMTHLEILEKGDTIKVLGIFLSVSHRGITLEDCELLD